MKRLSKILSIFNVWSWPYNMYYDIHEWNIVRKAVKETKVKELLKESDIRVDNISRMYTVISIDKDLSKNPNSIWPAIMEKLKPLDTVMAKIGCSEIVFPRIERIDNINFLITLAPEFDYLNLKAIAYEIVKWLFYWLIIGTLNNVLLTYLGLDYLGAISNFFSNLFSYLPF